MVTSRFEASHALLGYTNWVLFLRVTKKQLQNLSLQVALF